MTREWQPGDVVVTAGGQFRAFRTEGRWVFQDGCVSSSLGEKHAGFRPLVAIDPEDREQAEQLVEQYYRLRGLGEPAVCESNYVNMQAALRSLIEPPKPEEPTGVGAVVADDRDRMWVRTGSWAYPWMPVANDPAGRAPKAWDDLNAVRILSKGVPQ